MFTYAHCGLECRDTDLTSKHFTYFWWGWGQDFRPFQKLNVSLIYLIHSFDVCFGVIVLLELSVVSMFQPSSWWFEVMQKDSEVILFFHYSIHCVQHTRSAGSKTASDHDATTTVLNRRYSVNTSLLLLQTYCTSCHCGRTTRSLFHGTVNLSLTKPFLCPCDQLQMWRCWVWSRGFLPGQANVKLTPL